MKKFVIIILLVVILICLFCYSCVLANFNEKHDKTKKKHKTISNHDIIRYKGINDNYIWMEAEGGAEYKPMIVKSDQSASQQIYIASYLTDATSINTPPSDGNIVFNFNISTNGTYRLWIRAITPDTSSNSYWIKMDSNSWIPWENISPNSTWSWAVYSDAFNLSAGSHELIIAYRESNTKLDKILITTDLAYQPSSIGDPIPVPTGSNSYRSNIVDTYGNLQVIGTKLCDKYGNPIQLRGVSTHGFQWFPIFKDITIPNIVESWNVDIIRPAMYVEDYKDDNDFWNGYLAHPNEMKQWEKDFIEDAISAGVYVIIDWHIHNDPENFTEQAKAFFDEMSRTYGGYPNVLYEICNEPLGPMTTVTWEKIKNYANQVIPVIRSNDPDNIIIVGTPEWSQRVDVAANAPITGYNNIVYALHFYAASHKQAYRDYVTYAMNRICIMATEWGTSDYNTSINDFPESQTWIDFLNNNNISWINWSFSNKDETCSILKPPASLAGPWTDADYTESGGWVKDKIKQSRVTYNIGDVNHDTKIDNVDALMVCQYYVGLNPSNFDPSLADVNNDGKINPVDSLKIQQYYEGIIPSLD